MSLQPRRCRNLRPVRPGDRVHGRHRAAERPVLGCDAARGNQYHEHMAQLAPHVLELCGRIVVDGRTLERPVNYALARIIPPAGVEIDPRRRPFVIVDPRAGHGPGIGGFKADSEIGVAFKAGHPCYFVGFLPDPVPGQTMEDIARAEAVFVEKVTALHPDADAKPCVIGNCQAGWAVMMLAAMRPELFGPIIVAGSPLSYWGGVHGKYPMRYPGGLLGGSWLTALTSDSATASSTAPGWCRISRTRTPPTHCGPSSITSSKDRRRGAALSRLRALVGRARQPERRGNPVHRRQPVHRQQSCGRPDQGLRRHAIDLRNIRSPIVVFCSKGDNVTPPQQALDGFSISMTASTTSARTAKRSSTPSTNPSVIWASSCRPRSRARSTANSPTTST